MDDQDNLYSWLPDLVLLEIFKNLPSIEDRVELTKVCKRFRNIAQMTRSLWRKVKLNGTLADGELGEILQFPIGELDLSRIDMTLSRDAIFFLPGSKAADPNFHLSLQKLNLFTTWESCNRTHEIQILEKCRPVELVLDYSCVTLPLFEALSKNTNLKVLSMKYVRYLDKSAIYHDVQFDSIHLPNVEKLLLDHPRPCPSSDPRIEYTFLEILRNCTNLEHLSLSSNSLTPRIVEFMANLEFLESLWFCVCDWRGFYHELPRALHELPRVKALHIASDEKSCLKECRDTYPESSEFLRNHFPRIKTEFAKYEIDIITLERKESGFRKFLLGRNQV